MKRTPLLLRILGGILIPALLLLGCVHPMLTQSECTALLGLSHRGKPYVFGKEGPDSFDCSGLTMDACKYFGVELIHSAKYVAYDEQYTDAELGTLIPGDLIFFDTVADKDRYDHVGIWLGMNRFVHASSSEMVVMISEFDEHWQKCYSGAKRIIEPYADENPLYQLVQRVFCSLQLSASQSMAARA